MINIWHRIFRKAIEPRGFVLALGGGGGRGLAHLGVLEALEEHGLKPEAIVGTSIGALFGAMYALEPDIKRMRNRVEALLHSDAFSRLALPDLTEAETADHTWLGKLTAAARQSVLYARAAKGTALTDTEALLNLVQTLCEGKGFSDIRIPLFATTVQFPSGEIEIFSKGNLPRAIAASMAIPGVFEPVEISGQHFVDGGLACELPAKEAKMLAKPGQLIVAVNVGGRPNPDLRPSTVIGMLDWAIRIKSLYMRQYKAQFADLLIEPVTGFRQWADFSHPDQEIERGRQAALEKMPELMEQLGLNS